MKTYNASALLVLILPFCIQISFAQPARSCCKISSTSVFVLLAKNESFRSSHTDPLSFEYDSPKGKMISIMAVDGKNATAFEIKADKPTTNYLFVIHEWWGLNDYIKQEAEILQSELGNVNVLALDLYDGKIATHADEAGKLMGAAKEKRIRSIINAAISYVGKNARIETIGWCFGGGWSLQASIIAGKQGSGCVMYYGMPETDVKKLKMLQAPVLGIFAVKDEWITPEKVNLFLSTMKQNGKDITVQSFFADHAFANPSNPKYNKPVADEAHKLAVKFLKEHLK